MLKMWKQQQQKQQKIHSMTKGISVVYTVTYTHQYSLNYLRMQLFAIILSTEQPYNKLCKEKHVHKKNAMKIYVKMCINSAKFINCSQYHIMHTHQIFCFLNVKKKRKMKNLFSI